MCQQQSIQRAENSWRSPKGQHSEKILHPKVTGWPLNKMCTSSKKMIDTHNSKTYKWTKIKTRLHTLKCLTFFTYHWYYVDSPKYKALLQLSHKLNINQENLKHWSMNHENEVKVRWTMPGRHVQLTILPYNKYSSPNAYKLRKTDQNTNTYT